MKSYIVIGMGKFGAEAAKRLCQLGGEVLAIDRNPDLVQPISNQVTQAVVGDLQSLQIVSRLLSLWVQLPKLPRSGGCYECLFLSNW